MRRRFLNGAIRNDYIILEVLDNYISFGLSRNPIEYSLDDGISWVKLNAGTQTPIYTNIPRVLIRCTPTYIGIYDGIGTFTVYGRFNLSGNVMALLGGLHNLNDFIFNELFKETDVVSVDKSFLPATTLASGCYSHMFKDCTSLTTAPELPAMNLADSCYGYMFNGCTSLTIAPELPATNLADRCYVYMFGGCTNLNHIKMLATDVSAFNCLYHWVEGVAPTGTFVKHKDMTSLPTGDSGIPEGWTVVNDNGSDLIAFSIETPNHEFPLLERYAEEGMTWEEWCNSEYNLMYEDEGQFFEILGEEVYHYDEGWCVCAGAFAVNKNDIIENGSVYTYG